MASNSSESMESKNTTAINDKAGPSSSAQNEDQAGPSSAKDMGSKKKKISISEARSSSHDRIETQCTTTIGSYCNITGPILPAKRSIHACAGFSHENPSQFTGTSRSNADHIFAVPASPNAKLRPSTSTPRASSADHIYNSKIAPAQPGPSSFFPMPSSADHIFNKIAPAHTQTGPSSSTPMASAASHILTMPDPRHAQQGPQSSTPRVSSANHCYVKIAPAHAQPGQSSSSPRAPPTEHIFTMPAPPRAQKGPQCSTSRVSSANHIYAKIAPAQAKPGPSSSPPRASAASHIFTMSAPPRVPPRAPPRAQPRSSIPRAPQVFQHTIPMLAPTGPNNAATPRPFYDLTTKCVCRVRGSEEVRCPPALPMREIWVTCPISNVIIKVQKIYFHCNRLVLRSACSMLRPLLATNIPVIELPLNIKPDFFLQILLIVYHDGMWRQCSIDELKTIGKIAHCLGIPIAETFINKHLALQINNDWMFWNILEYGCTVASMLIIQQCLLYTSHHADSILSSDEMLKFAPTFLLNVVKLEKLNRVNEAYLFLVCERWGKANAARFGGNAREALGDVINNIRFLTFSIEDFNTLVLESEILSIHEKKLVMHSIKEKNDFLPGYFSKLWNRRIN